MARRKQTLFYGTAVRGCAVPGSNGERLPVGSFTRLSYEYECRDRYVQYVRPYGERLGLSLPGSDIGRQIYVSHGTLSEHQENQSSKMTVVVTDFETEVGAQSLCRPPPPPPVTRYVDAMQLGLAQHWMGLRRGQKPTIRS